MTKELDSFSLAAKSGENPFETKSYDDGFQSANSFFSAGSQSALDQQQQQQPAVPPPPPQLPTSTTAMTTTTTIKAFVSTATATSSSIPSSASFPLDDGGKHLRRGFTPSASANAGFTELVDANLYESQGDASPDSGVQASLA